MRSTTRWIATAPGTVLMRGGSSRSGRFSLKNGACDRPAVDARHAVRAVDQRRRARRELLGAERGRARPATSSAE